MSEQQTQVRNGVPILPLRDVVVYPHMVIPLFVGREKSILALDAAMAAGKQILLIVVVGRHQDQRFDENDAAENGQGNAQTNRRRERAQKRQQALTCGGP